MPTRTHEHDSAGVLHRLRRKASGVRSWVHARPAGPLIWRGGVALTGLAVTIVGIVLLAAPGPGWAVIFLGLGIWATEFAWAKSLLNRVRRTVGKWAAWVERQPRWLSVLVGAVGLLVLAAAATAGWLLVVK